MNKNQFIEEKLREFWDYSTQLDELRRPITSRLLETDIRQALTAAWDSGAVAERESIFTRVQKLGGYSTNSEAVEHPELNESYNQAIRDVLDLFTFESPKEGGDFLIHDDCKTYHGSGDIHFKSPKEPTT